MFRILHPTRFFPTSLEPSIALALIRVWHFLIPALTLLPQLVE